jgi:predicted nuclease of restriction endonuclease-like RecB superfamily
MCPGKLHQNLFSHSSAPLFSTNSRKEMLDKAAASWDLEKAHLQAVLDTQREDIEMLTTTNEALNTALEIKVCW